VQNLLQEEFLQFSKFLSSIDSDHIESYKDDFFDRIEKISKLINEQPNPENARDEFFNVCCNIEKSPLHKRTRKKPLGYPGDFLLIDWIYTREVKGRGIGELFDEMFHLYEAAIAVRNRKEFFINKCKELADSNVNQIDILDIGCGSCRDIVDAHTVCDNGTRFYYHCVDHEKEAINYAKKLLKNARISDRVQLDCCNAFQLRTKKQYDLIWSAGLFDYLSNRTAKLLIRKLWKNLKPGGQLIFGNFSPTNPTRMGMELIGKWYLIHRSSHELLKLCDETGIVYRTLHVESEPMGVNLFCILTK
jgi:extracellular factor (EF) 3-hydroxypalmitic acid methyl ester biosynthesis protein